MPELPEVETVVRLVRPRLEGRRVESVHVTWTRTLGGQSRAAYTRALTGATLARVWRRAKFIVCDLERGGELAGWLVGHLRMTGRLTVEPARSDPGSYRRVSLALDDGRVLHFLDVRKFGRLVFTDDLPSLLGELGPEPLDEAFTAERFHAALRERRRALKPLLLDQSFLAGLGNIYADECLHRAGLHPLARSDRVTRARAERLLAEIRRVLAEAIAREGSSFDTFYRTPEGQPGAYQHQFQVYGRDGRPCRTCGTTIVKSVVAQRGTHHCPKCQGRGPRGRSGARPGR
ncbi:MAG TPA: bifunctional DNA-formamidopyrimidine glycosylase/DNA-(apurinic or apyrimidinic site) lyase [Planctomycetota bacterium]|nr:bifunctional DNA-formamidopyrimidine glycosylase/DNA-(apurinic or apyrimidinic site) lyase [Planctomycetota bacterium]